VENPPREEPVLDERRLASLRALGDDTVADLVGLFLDTTVERLMGLADALAKADAPGVVRAAHVLRGSSANLGFAAFASACEQLENDARAGRADAAELHAAVEAAWVALQEPALALARRAP